MLQPARTKYRKQQKGRNTGVATRGAKVSFGDFGLKATERGRLTARQIEAARRAMTRHIKRGGRIWIRIFPDKPISRKPAEVRNRVVDAVELVGNLTDRAAIADVSAEGVGKNYVATEHIHRRCPRRSNLRVRILIGECRRNRTSAGLDARNVVN